MHSNMLLVFVVMSGAALVVATDTCDGGECAAEATEIRDDNSALQTYSKFMKGQRKKLHEEDMCSKFENVPGEAESPGYTFAWNKCKDWTATNGLSFCGCMVCGDLCKAKDGEAFVSCHVQCLEDGNFSVADLLSLENAAVEEQELAEGEGDAALMETTTSSGWWSSDRRRRTLEHYEWLVWKDKGWEPRQALMKYAEEKVNANLDAIKQNIQNKGIHNKTMDLLWPGHGYNNVANGGVFEVLTLLEKKDILRVGKVMGASGGAASGILAIAGGTDELLKWYMVYARWAADVSWWESMVMQGVYATYLWEKIYRRVVQDWQAFKRVKERAWVAVACGTMTNSVLYNYRTRDQVAQAFYASGDASLQGISSGTNIDGMFWKLGGTCGDGGSPTYFPESSNPLMYQDVDLGYTTECTNDSIEKLFKKGVDQTISFLKSSNFKTNKMKGVIPTGGRVTDADYRNAELDPKCVHFYDVKGGGHKSQSCR